jgi:trimeric autotransporter adhesin
VGPTASTPSGAVLATARWQATAPTLATTAAVTAAAAAAAATAAAIAAPSANASDGAADVLFTHVLNPFFADSAEHKLAMRLTFASLAAAAATAEAQGVTVELLAAVLPRDKGVVRASLPATEQLLRAHSDGAPSGAAQLASGAALKALQAAVRSARNIREVELSASASLRTALPEVSHKIDLPLLPDDR